MHKVAAIEYESKGCQKYKKYKLFDKNDPVWSCSYFKVQYKGKFPATILNSQFENGLSYKDIYYIKKFLTTIRNKNPPLKYMKIPNQFILWPRRLLNYCETAGPSHTIFNQFFDVIVKFILKENCRKFILGVTKYLKKVS